MRAILKGLFVLPLVLGAAIVADARILGGGPAKTDCFMYFDGPGITATTGKFRVDARSATGACNFQVQVCTGATDVAGCTPADVTAFKGNGTKKLNLPPVGAPGQCSTPKDISLKLKKHGTRPNTVKYKLGAKTAHGTDQDTLVLHCEASPSGAFIFE